MRPMSAGCRNKQMKGKQNDSNKAKHQNRRLDSAPRRAALPHRGRGFGQRAVVQLQSNLANHEIRFVARRLVQSV